MSWYFSTVLLFITIIINIIIIIVFPGIAAASSSGDTGLRNEEWWEMFKNVGEKTNKWTNGRTNEGDEWTN